MKIKAFSFLELLVSIVISGIVISTAYSVYVFTYKQFNKFTTVKTGIRDYFELSTVLNRDIEMAKKVIRNNNQEIELRLVDKIIYYNFGESTIVRTVDLHADTFFFDIAKIEINTIDEPVDEQLVDYLKIMTKDKVATESWSFYKDYGAIIKIGE